ncbi:MAG: hypothetical protein K0Q78_2556, partial [Cellvibrio sp.]|nr:hypothetical protein [Cellvibrio sp.]
MALDQSLHQSPARQHNSHSIDLAEAVERGEFILSLST